MNHSDSTWTSGDSRPAAQLRGLTLPRGWIVKEPMRQPQDSTGGTFSVPYIVNSKEKGAAFLKAMDYQSFSGGDSTETKLQIATQQYNHEFNLLQECNEMTHVVRLIDHGKIYTNPNDDYSKVFYFIFELAECDIRTHMRKPNYRNIARLLYLMHNVATAIQQLHNQQIAHLDVKPSNVLIFEQQGAKLADMGRSINKNTPGPFDTCRCVGDPKYAPPEALYNDTHPEWKTHRLGGDFYLLGNLMFYLLSGHSITQIVLERLRGFNPNLYPTNQLASYDEALPLVNRIFLHLIQELRENTHADAASEIINIVRQLCDPDPTLRGLPMNRDTCRYSLQELMLKLNLLHEKYLPSQ